MALVCVLFTLILGVYQLPRLSGQVFESRGGEADPSVVMQCEGSDVMLNKATLGVNIHHVFVSRGDESLASSSVAATGQFQGRLTVDSNGRVTLANLTLDDLGKYRVEVKLSEDKKIHSSLRLVISEPPATTDRKLLVNKMLSTGSGSVRLTCGKFTSLGFPPVSVLWKDPQGKIIPSDGFEDHVFYLDLSVSSAMSGDYCCQLDCRAPDYCCLDQRSSLRQCAPVHVQTDMVQEVRKMDCPSLDSFSHLQQQVVDLAAALRVMQESESQSGVATIAQLVQRQAKCDQLDAYMSRVEDLEDKLKKGLDAATNHSTDFGLNLETRLMKLQEIFRNQVTDDVDRLESNANSSQQTLQTRLEEMSRAMNDHQNRTGKQYADLEKESKKTFVDLQTEMNNKLARIEGTLTMKVSELVTITAENLTRSAQALASLEVKSASQMSELKNKLTTIQDTLTSHVTSTSQLHDSLRSDVANLTQSLKGDYCTSKRGYRSFNKRCMKVSDDSVGYLTAKANCLLEEAHLVALKSPDVDEPVLRGVIAATGIIFPSSINVLSFWLGADDISTEGSFVWSDGSPLLNSSALWRKGEPNNVEGNEDCVEMYINTDVVSLNDNNCGVKHRYVCEYDRKSESTLQP